MYEVTVSDDLVVTPTPGKPALLLGGFDIAELGYGAEEFFVSSTASSYTSADELSPDGQWTVTPADSADYTTRIVVLTPTDPAPFNGTVLVEWLNVSGGIDAPAVWMMAHREMVRAGYAYVAVSAQRVGVEGGANLMGIDMSLKSQDATTVCAAASSRRRVQLRHLFPGRRAHRSGTRRCCWASCARNTSSRWASRSRRCS